MAWPLQCVTCLGSLEQVSAKNFATVCRRQLGRIRRACFVAQQGFNDSIGIPYLPAPYSRAAYPGFADHLGDGQSLVRQQHNSGTLDLLLRAVSIYHNRSQLLLISITNDDENWARSCIRRT